MSTCFASARYRRALARPCHKHGMPPGSPCFDVAGTGAVCTARLKEEK